MQNRIYALFVLVLVPFVAIGGRLWQLQVVEYETYDAESKDTIIARIDIPAERGSIYDRAGKSLAENIPVRAPHGGPLM